MEGRSPAPRGEDLSAVVSLREAVSAFVFPNASPARGANGIFTGAEDSDFGGSSQPPPWRDGREGATHGDGDGAQATAIAEIVRLFRNEDATFLQLLSCTARCCADTSARPRTPTGVDGSVFPGESARDSASAAAAEMNARALESQTRKFASLLPARVLEALPELDLLGEGRCFAGRAAGDSRTPLTAQSEHLLKGGPCRLERESALWMLLLRCREELEDWRTVEGAAASLWAFCTQHKALLFCLLPEEADSTLEEEASASTGASLPSPQESASSGDAKAPGGASLSVGVFVTRALLQKPHAPSFSHKVRQKLLKLLAELLQTCADGLRSEPQLALQVCRQLEGERDPRCLLILFQITETLGALYGSSMQREELEAVTDALMAYFPVSFSPPSHATERITEEELQLAFERAASSSALYGPFVLSVVLDVLPSLVNEADALREGAARDAEKLERTLAVCLPHYKTAAAAAAAKELSLNIPHLDDRVAFPARVAAAWGLLLRRAQLPNEEEIFSDSGQAEAEAASAASEELGRGELRSLLASIAAPLLDLTQVGSARFELSRLLLLETAASGGAASCVALEVAGTLVREVFRECGIDPDSLPDWGSEEGRTAAAAFKRRVSVFVDETTTPGTSMPAGPCANEDKEEEKEEDAAAASFLRSVAALLPSTGEEAALKGLTQSEFALGAQLLTFEQILRVQAALLVCWEISRAALEGGAFGNGQAAEPLFQEDCLALNALLLRLIQLVFCRGAYFAQAAPDALSLVLRLLGEVGASPLAHAQLAAASAFLSAVAVGVAFVESEAETLDGKDAGGASCSVSSSYRRWVLELGRFSEACERRLEAQLRLRGEAALVGEVWVPEKRAETGLFEDLPQPQADSLGSPRVSAEGVGESLLASALRSAQRLLLGHVRRELLFRKTQRRSGGCSGSRLRGAPFCFFSWFHEASLSAAKRALARIFAEGNAEGRQKPACLAEAEEEDRRASRELVLLRALPSHLAAQVALACCSVCTVHWAFGAGEEAVEGLDDREGCEQSSVLQWLLRVVTQTAGVGWHSFSEVGDEGLFFAFAAALDGLASALGMEDALRTQIELEGWGERRSAIVAEAFRFLGLDCLQALCAVCARVSLRGSEEGGVWRRALFRSVSDAARDLVEGLLGSGHGNCEGASLAKRLLKAAADDGEGTFWIFAPAAATALAASWGDASLLGFLRAAMSYPLSLPITKEEGGAGTSSVGLASEAVLPFLLEAISVVFECLSEPSALSEALTLVRRVASSLTADCLCKSCGETPSSHTPATRRAASQCANVAGLFLGAALRGLWRRCDASTADAASDAEKKSDSCKCRRNQSQSRLLAEEAEPALKSASRCSCDCPLCTAAGRAFLKELLLCFCPEGAGKKERERWAASGGSFLCARRFAVSRAVLVVLPDALAEAALWLSPESVDASPSALDGSSLSKAVPLKALPAQGRPWSVFAEGRGECRKTLVARRRAAASVCMDVLHPLCTRELAMLAAALCCASSSGGAGETREEETQQRDPLQALLQEQVLENEKATMEGARRSAALEFRLPLLATLAAATASAASREALLLREPVASPAGDMGLLRLLLVLASSWIRARLAPLYRHRVRQMSVGAAAAAFAIWNAAAAPGRLARIGSTGDDPDGDSSLEGGWTARDSAATENSSTTNQVVAAAPGEAPLVEALASNFLLLTLWACQVQQEQEQETRGQTSLERGDPSCHRGISAVCTLELDFLKRDLPILGLGLVSTALCERRPLLRVLSLEALGVLAEKQVDRVYSKHMELLLHEALLDERAVVRQAASACVAKWNWASESQVKAAPPTC